MMMDVSAEELGNDNEDEAKDETLVGESESGVYVTPHTAIGIGATTRPTPDGLIPGLSAGGGGAMISFGSALVCGRTFWLARLWSLVSCACRFDLVVHANIFSGCFKGPRCSNLLPLAQICSCYAS